MIKSIISEVFIGILAKLVGFILFTWVVSTYGIIRSVDEVVFASTICFAIIGFLGGITQATIFTPISLNFGVITDDTAAMIDLQIKWVFLTWLAIYAISALAISTPFYNTELPLELIIISSLCVLFGSLYEIISQLYKSMGKYFHVNSKLLLINIISISILFPIIKNPLVLIYVQTLTFFLLFVALYLPLYRKNQYRFSVKRVVSAKYFQLLKVIPPIGLQGLFGMLANLIPFLITFQLSAGLITSYSLIRRIYDIFTSTVIYPTIGVMSPIINNNYNTVMRKDFEKLVVLIFTPASLIALFHTHEISLVITIIGITAEEFGLGLAILLMSSLALSLNSIFTRSILQKQQQKSLYQLNYLTVIPAIVMPILTYYLGNWYGLIGVCLGYTVYHVLIHVPISYMIDRKSYEKDTTYGLIKALLLELFTFIMFCLVSISLIPQAENLFWAFTKLIGLFIFYIALRAVLDKNIQTIILNIVSLKLERSR